MSSEWLDDYLEAFASAVSASDEGAWAPFDPYKLYPYYSRPYLDKMWKAFETADKKSLSPTELAKGFLGLVTLRVEIPVMMLMIKSSNYDRTKAMTLLNWLNNILCAKASEDPYGKNATKIHYPDQVKEMITLLPFRTVEIQEAKEIAKLVHACKELSWSLYSDFNYAQWFEVFGPHDLENGRQLVLHAFTNFEPKEIWQSMQGFEPNNVYVYAIYENAEIKLDQWSHVTTPFGSLPDKMRKTFILAHTKIIEKPEQLRELREKLENAAVEQGKKVKAMDFEEQKQWVVKTHWHSFRDFFNILGLDWKPTEEMMDAVKGKPLLNANYPKFETLEEKKQFWKKLFDPRNDYFLKGLRVN